MTKEELREHCEKQVKMCEEWAKGNDREPSGKIYEEHKLILDLINELQDKSYELWKESYEEEHRRNIRLEEEIKALEQQSDDCVSRAEVIDELNRLGRNAFKDDTDYDNFFAFVDSLPPVTPTQCIATVQFNKEELREICNERIEIECTHGTCKDCAIKQLDKSESAEVGTEKYYCPIVSRYVDETPSFYCADFEKRGNENGSN